MADYTYTLANAKLEPVLRRIRTAAKPDRVTQELLATWGFTASNDRAIPRVLKLLGFLTESGAPTPAYDRLRDPNDWKFALADGLRSAYADLFAIDPEIYKANDAEVKGAISRITGKDEETVRRYFLTFKTLAALAEWAGERKASQTQTSAKYQDPPISATESAVPAPSTGTHRRSEYHYNIQIHLPATTDITVYNAIFKSLRENLGV